MTELLPLKEDPVPFISIPYLPYVGTSYLLNILGLEFEIVHSTTLLYVYVANSVDTDQMSHSAASDLNLHCLQMPVCPNI